MQYQSFKSSVIVKKSKQNVRNFEFLFVFSLLVESKSFLEQFIRNFHLPYLIVSYNFVLVFV
jgi:hypothetical protein